MVGSPLPCGATSMVPMTTMKTEKETWTRRGWLGVTGAAGLVAFAEAPPLHAELGRSYAEKILAKKPRGLLAAPWGGQRNRRCRCNRAWSRRSLPRHARPWPKPGAIIRGDIDTAVQLDGKQSYVEIPDHPDFSQPTSGKGLTVEAWMRPDVLNFAGETDDPYIMWLGKGSAGKYEWGLRFYTRQSTRPNRISAYMFNPEGGLGSGAYFERQADRWGMAPRWWLSLDLATRRSPMQGVTLYKNSRLRLGPSVPELIRNTLQQIQHHARSWRQPAAAGQCESQKLSHGRIGRSGHLSPRVNARRDSGPLQQWQSRAQIVRPNKQSLPQEFGRTDDAVIPAVAKIRKAGTRIKNRGRSKSAMKGARIMQTMADTELDASDSQSATGPKHGARTRPAMGAPEKCLKSGDLLQHFRAVGRLHGCQGCAFRHQDPRSAQWWECELMAMRFNRCDGTKIYAAWAILPDSPDLIYNRFSIRIRSATANHADDSRGGPDSLPFSFAARCAAKGGPSFDNNFAKAAEVRPIESQLWGLRRPRPLYPSSWEAGSQLEDGFESAPAPTAPKERLCKKPPPALSEPPFYCAVVISGIKPTVMTRSRR